jgi:hypothetical protein
MNLVDRLEANSTWEPNSGCRIWLGALNKEHGVIKVAGKSMDVHRVAWELARGPIPKGLWVLHNCGLGPCFNVDHLRLGTRIENRRELNRPGGYSYFPQCGSQVPVSRNPIQMTRHERIPRAVYADLDQDELRRVMSYDPVSGHFRHRSRADRDQTWHTRFAGQIAGAVQGNGYHYIVMGPKHYLAHRLAWLYMTGELPDGQIDHINGDRTDNRWANLRAATQMQNSMNVGLRSTNKSGVKGVCWDAGKKSWKAAIMVAGKTINLGRFKTLVEATEARRAAEVLYHGDFTHTAGNA